MIFTWSPREAQSVMYEDAAKQLDVILELVKKCPDPLQERCLGILLQGYVDAEKAKQTGAGERASAEVLAS